MSDSSDSTDLQPAPTKTAVQPSRHSRLSALLQAQTRLSLALWPTILLLALLLGYLYWQVQQQAQTLLAQQAELTDVHRAQQPLQTGYSELNNLLQLTQQQLREQRTTLDQLRATLTDTRRQLVLQAATTTDDWLFAEGVYLLRLANQRLIIEADGEGALNLLMATDALLADIDSVDTLEIRQQLALEINQMRRVNPVDLNGSYFQLEAHRQWLQQLKWQPRFEPKPPQAVITPTDATPAGHAPSPRPWYTAAVQQGWAAVQRALSSLSRYITYSRGNPQLTLTLSDQQFQLVRQQLLIQLTQAQMALLDRNLLLYRTSLEQVQQGLSQYFPLQPQVAQVNTELQALAALNLIPVWPDISTSLTLLQGYIDSRHRLSNPLPTAQESPP